MDENEIPNGLTPEEFEAHASALVQRMQLAATAQQPVPDEEFDRITALLSMVGKTSWSERPRTYVVLRIINRVDAMDSFVVDGLRDIHFPYTELRLPSGLTNLASRLKFIEVQNIVLTKVTDLEVEGARHRHFSSIADNRFLVIKQLGQGGFGYVDHVQSKISLQEYARKRTLRGKAFRKDTEAIKTFENDLQNCKRLQHHHLVKYVGSYTDPKYIGLLMSPVADCDLKTFLDRVPFPESDLIVLRSFFGCLAASVQYLHGQKCRHKDIKPANILVKGTNVLLTDFGTARDWSDKSHGTTVGPSGPYTAGYVAPEVVDQEPRNDSSDIWSLGCVFLDIVTVLKGETSESRKAYFSSRYSGGVNPRTNPEATKEWLARLEASSAADNEPLVWIKEMLQPSRFNRISASSLFDKIVNHNEQHRYVGPCCTDDDDSDIASYTGSTYQENITNPLHQEVAETSGTLVNKKDPENENIKLEESEYIPEPRHFLVSPLEDHNGDITRKSPNSSQLRWTLDASEERRANTTNKFEPPNPPSKPAERQFESQKPFDRSRGGSNYTRSGLPPINSLTTADNQLSPIPADPHHTNPLPNDPTYLEAVGSSSKPPLHPRKENEPRPAEAIIRADPPSTETSWFRRMFRRKYNQAQPDSDPPTNAATADYDTTEPAYGGIRGTADFVRSRDASPAPPLRNAYSAASSYTQPFAARHDVDTTLGISDFHA